MSLTGYLKSPLAALIKSVQFRVYIETILLSRRRLMAKPPVLWALEIGFMRSISGKTDTGVVDDSRETKLPILDIRGVAVCFHSNLVNANLFWYVALGINDTWAYIIMR